MSLRTPRSALLARALQKAWTLSRGDWAILVCALGLLPVASVSLRIVGLRRVLAFVEMLAPERGRRRAGEPGGAARTARLVETAARCCRPRPACLAKALVVFSLLRRRGLPAELVIGVTRARGPLEGHAWVRLGGADVGDPGRFTALARVASDRLPAAPRAAREHAP